MQVQSSIVAGGVANATNNHASTGHAANILSRPASESYRRIPITPGMKVCRPPTPNTTSPNRVSVVIEPATRQGVFKSYFNGIWKLLCFCGNTYQATTTEINRLSTRALSCGCKNMRKPHAPRRLDFPTRPGAQRHIGKVYGRLTVLEWLPRQGWHCQCECGADELVERSSKLGSQGMKRCPHASTSTSTSTSTPASKQ